MSPDSYPEKIEGSKRFRKWWVRWAGSIAFILVVIIGGLGLMQLQNQANSTREGLIKSCKTNNKDKHLEKEALKTQNLGAKNFDPRVLVPNINIYAYKNVINQSIIINEKRMENIKIVDCEKRYPETGPFDFI